VESVFIIYLRIFPVIEIVSNHCVTTHLKANFCHGFVKKIELLHSNLQKHVTVLLHIAFSFSKNNAILRQKYESNTTKIHFHDPANE
jgi:hypothetical protein